MFAPAFDCQAPCAALPKGVKEKSFSLSVLVHRAALDQVRGPGMFSSESERPMIGVSAKGCSKATEAGSWSRERGQWEFNQPLVLQVNAEDEVSLTVSAISSNCLAGDTGSASASSSTAAARPVAEWKFSVSQVLARLRMEERAGDGLVYATPAIGFDVVPVDPSAGGAGPSGRVFLSFETKTPWAVYCDEEESLPSLLNSDALWEGPAAWEKRGACGEAVPA